MQGTRQKKSAKDGRPLPSLFQTEAVAKSAAAAVPPHSSLLLSTQQQHTARTSAAQQPPTTDTHIIEQELQSLRSGTHPGYLRALDSLDAQQNDHILAVQRLRDERLHNVEEMYVAEMQGIDDDYKDQAEAIREKMIEELIAKSEGPKTTDMVTRKRAKGAKDERPKKKANIKGIRPALLSEEISSDLEAVRSRILGTAGGTRSKAKAAQ